MWFKHFTKNNFNKTNMAATIATLINVHEALGKITGDSGSIQGPNGEWKYDCKGQVGGKIFKEGPKWKYQCILTTPQGVFTGKGKSSTGAIENALNKANDKLKSG